MLFTVNQSDSALTQNSANEVASKSDQENNFLVLATQSVCHSRIISASSKSEAKKLFLDEILCSEDFIDEAEVVIKSVREIKSN